MCGIVCITLFARAWYQVRSWLPGTLKPSELSGSPGHVFERGGFASCASDPHPKEGAEHQVAQIFGCPERPNVPKVPQAGPSRERETEAMMISKREASVHSSQESNAADVLLTVHVL